MSKTTPLTPQRDASKRRHKFQSFAFYISEKRGKGRQPITLPDGRTAYVRVEGHGCDCLEAMNSLSPRHDEDTMNTHDLRGAK